MVFVGVPIAQMNGLAAMTLSGKIRSRVNALIEEHGIETVKSLVKAASDDLWELSIPLEKSDPKEYHVKRKADLSADSVIAGIHNRTTSTIQTYSQDFIPLNEAQKQELEAAQTIQNKCFAKGTFYLKRSWIEQFGAMRILRRALSDPEVQECSEIMGLKNSFDLFQSIYDAYGETMGFSAETEEAKKPSEYMDEWYDGLETFLAAIMCSHKKGSEIRTRLEEPYVEFATSIRKNRKQREKDSKSGSNRTPIP